MFNAIGKFIGHHVFYPIFLVFNLLVSSPVLFAFARIAGYLEAHQSLRVLGWVLRVFVFLLFACDLYVSLVMTDYVISEKRLFWDAFKAAWANVWFNLEWLPGIGHWFERPRDPRADFEDNDDHHPPRVG